MKAEPHTETERLAELISGRRELLEQLREVSGRQLDVIGEGDMQRLFALLSSKQVLLGRLQQVDRQLEPFRGQDPDSRRWRSTADRERTRQTAQRCESLLGEIMLVEKQCEAELTRRRDDTAGMLAGMHTAAKARSAYGDALADSGGRLDLTSES